MRGFGVGLTIGVPFDGNEPSKMAALSWAYSSRSSASPVVPTVDRSLEVELVLGAGLRVEWIFVVVIRAPE